MSIPEDTLKETKTSRLYLAELGRLLQRIYIVGIILIVLVLGFGCNITYFLWRILNK